MLANCAVAEGDPEQCRAERLRDRERGLDRSPVVAVEVALIDQGVAAQHDERGGVGGAEQLAERSAGHPEVVEVDGITLEPGRVGRCLDRAPREP
jgi:hypothetical protein